MIKLIREHDHALKAERHQIWMETLRIPARGPKPERLGMAGDVTSWPRYHPAAADASSCCCKASCCFLRVDAMKEPREKATRLEATRLSHRTSAFQPSRCVVSGFMRSTSHVAMANIDRKGHIGKNTSN